MTDRPGEDAHVLEEALEYATGRLTPERRAEIDAHLARCAECEAHFAFVTALETDVSRSGARHVRPGRIVAVTEQAGAAAALSIEEQEHLDACPQCRDDLAWARHAPPMPADPVPSASPARAPAESVRASRARARPAGLLARLRTALAGRRPAPVWGFGLAGAAVAVVFFTLRIGGPDEGALRDLARIEPLPPPQVTRSAVVALSGALRDGSEAYAAGAYERAAASFARAAVLAPERSDVHLYLGSSLMLAGRMEDAARSFHKAVDASAADPALREEALWQLAQALLAAGDRDGAAESLRGVMRLRLDRRDEAAALLEAIAGR